jgi:tetratricopeptide (TPR) repeat protein
VKLANSPAQRNRKAELLKTAHAQYEESHKVLQASRETIKKQLEGMKAALNSKTQQEEITARNELRREYLQLQLLGALILEETADTLEPGSAEFKKVLADAAKQFDEIYTKYRSLYAGVYSRACQGRCHKKLGQLKEALGCFSKILQLSDNPAFREVKTATLVLAMECWLDASQKKYSQAIQQGSVWVEGMRPNEINKPEWLKMRLLLAEAHRLWADELKAKNPRDKQVRRSQNQARKLARDVARFPGDYQDQARALLARLPDGDSARIKEDDPSQK